MNDSNVACASGAKLQAAAPNHLIYILPIVVLFPHNRCNCRCIMCDIWRIRQVREITRDDLESRIQSLLDLQVRWVVLSGGEPQLATDFVGLCCVLRGCGIRVTLLTAGLLLHAHARSVADTVDDVIVSLDGPPEVHDQIRRVPAAFDRLARGVAALRRLRAGMAISGRCTVQNLNFDHLRETVCAAKRIGLNSISFLAADLSSEAFNREGGWTPQRQDEVALTSEQVDCLEREMESVIHEHAAATDSGYLAEGPEKLRRIVLHFRAHLGQSRHIAPRCNAPWVSTVIEADGTVRPCFFHRGLGNIHERSLPAILNDKEAVNFRASLDVASNPVCQRCVCSLYLDPSSTQQL